MKKWEYKTEFFVYGEFHHAGLDGKWQSMDDLLKEQGEQGWEAYHIESFPTQKTFFFKREIEG